MAVPKIVVAEIERFCEKWTPPEYRDQMRLEASVRGNSVTVSERRPPWDDSDGEWWTLRVAQLRHKPETGQWTLHWADRNERWHLYDQVRPTKNLGRLLEEIDEDPMCIFFG